ncbi:putative DNA helicase ino-80 [Diplocarpon rosae]|nr:putative DNA helicase ino-80 [Diplocarpon rosae]
MILARGDNAGTDLRAVSPMEPNLLGGVMTIFTAADPEPAKAKPKRGGAQKAEIENAKKAEADREANRQKRKLNFLISQTELYSHFIGKKIKTDEGLNWLVNLYEQGINGILADEMGLGKTVQSISVMAYLAEKHGIWGPFLVVAPASTLHNWQQEITNNNRYYDPTSDSSERRPAESVGSGAHTQTQTPQAREPYTYPTSVVEPLKYYNGAYTTPAAAPYPPRSPATHAHPRRSSLTLSPRMATMASPNMRHNGVVMGSPGAIPPPVATTPARPADPMAMSSILSSADPLPKPTPPLNLTKPRKQARQSVAAMTEPVSRDSSRQSSAAPIHAPASRAIKFGRHALLGEARYRDIHLDAAVTSVQEKEVQAEKERKKDMQRKRRREKTVAANMEQKEQAIAKAQEAQDEASRTKYIKEAQRAEKKAQRGARLRKSKEQKQAEKDSAEAAQAAIDAGEELAPPPSVREEPKIRLKFNPKDTAREDSPGSFEPYVSKGYNQIYDQIWRDMARKDVNKTHKLAVESYTVRTSNLKKTAILASKEAKRWQLKTNKGTKDLQARAKRVMREMMAAAMANAQSAIQEAQNKARAFNNPDEGPAMDEEGEMNFQNPAGMGDVDIEQPKMLNAQLKEYQLKGLNWLDQLKRLHMILKPFMLRRVKKHVQKELGDKIELDIFCDLTYRQRAYYSNLRNQISIMDLIEKATVGDDNDTGTLMNLVMQFRKVCNHPDLFERAETTSPFSFGHFAETASFMREGALINVAYSSRNLIEYELPRLIWRHDGRLDMPGRDNERAGFRGKYMNQLMNIFTPEHIRETSKGSEAFSFLRFADTSVGEASNAARNCVFSRAVDLAQKPRRLGPMSIIYDEEDDRNFTPPQAMLNILLFELKEGGHRVLLYFQMTRMIDLMEEYLTYRNYKYCRLDGSTKLEDRRDTVHDFQTRPEIFIFLLSTRAGGLGINLTSADTVIFYDSDWNPTIDSQAMDRSHRLGQTRQVTVYRLITRGTIEERIRKQKAKKGRKKGKKAEAGGSLEDLYHEGRISLVPRLDNVQ